MVSVVGLGMREQLKLLKPLTAGASIESQRKAQNFAGELGEKAVASKLVTADEHFDNFKAAVITPKEFFDEDRALLYLHGGAYVAGGIEYSLGFGSVLAARSGMTTLCAAYRLAPEHVFPCAIDDALEAYERLLSKGYSPDNISFVGESAGGGLLFALLLRLKDEGKPMPRSTVALSPWTDLTLSLPSYTENADVDPTLSLESLKFCARLYASYDLDNPYVSPLYGNLAGLPRSLIIAGSCELLLDDAREMAKKLSASGCDCTLVISEGMWHVFPLFGVPESRAALDNIDSFLKETEQHE